MNPLVGGASTQSRARRVTLWPDARVMSRSATHEIWLAGGEYRSILTWVYDQGGPVLGYTCRSNPLTAGILRTVAEHEYLGMFGPGSIVSDLEVRAARSLVEAVGPVFPADELWVRFFQNGSDACDAAVRVARAATGRKKYISIGYHGSSQLFATPPQCGGVLAGAADGRTLVEFGDVDGLRAAWTKETACAIIEVPSTDEKEHAFFDEVDLLRLDYGGLLILDEVVTGFRLSFHGAAGHYALCPDLACYGKALSNGRPVAALVGDRQIMDTLVDNAFHSCTMNGDPQGMAHVLGTLETLKTMDYSALWQIGESLRAALPAGVVVGHAPRTFTTGLTDARKRALVERGVVMDRPNYATFATTEADIRETAEAYERMLDAERSEF